SSHQKSCPLHKPQPTARKTHGLGNLLGDLHVGRVQENVVGNQKLTRAYNRSSRRRMYSWIAEIRLSRGIYGDFRPDSLKLSAPDVLQILPLRAGRGGFVQINRDLISIPDLLGNMPRHRHTIFDGETFDGNKWHHVGRPHPRMRALVDV